MPGPAPKYVVGVDAGGTATRSRLTDTSGNVLGHGEAGPGSLRLGGDAALCSVTAAVERACLSASVAFDPASINLGVGIAGFSFADARGQLERELAHLGFARVVIEGDQVTAWRGAHGGKDGGIVIVGTGSNAYGRVGNIEIQIGGHGFPMSDAGSGAWIGLEAVRAALNAHDGLETETPLTRAILQQVGGSLAQAIGWSQRATATEYAALTKRVVEHVTDGDPLARRLLQRAATDISHLVEALFTRGVPRVALLGGLAAIIQAHMPAATAARLSSPKGDALDGALMAARGLVRIS